MFTEAERERRERDGPPTPEQFRKAGMTGDAVNYPRTEAGFLWLCQFNGIKPEQAPRTFYYAPNAWVLKNYKGTREVDQ